MIISNNYNNLLTVLIYPDNKLKIKAKPIKKISKKVIDIANQMVNTMILHRAIGLSGTQVNYHKRIICFMDQELNKSTIMINPVIIERGEDLIMYKEGCLSLPETYIKVNRNKNIKVRYQSVEGTERIKTYSNLNAIIIQHEIDHLNGKLMIN